MWFRHWPIAISTSNKIELVVQYTYLVTTRNRRTEAKFLSKMRTKTLVLFRAPKINPCTIYRYAYEMPSHQLSRIGLHRFMSYNLQTQHNAFHTSERNSFTKSAQF